MVFIRYLKAYIWINNQPVTRIVTPLAPSGVNLGMKRASITFSDELESKLENYLKAQTTPPSLSSVVQVALEEYLDKQAFLVRGYKAATSELDLPVSDAEVKADVSLNHDKFV